ncbi:MAG: hypothetical protein ABF723_05195 [Lentilactobacillus hilgardii]|uniref:hypothetical protein n=1 Tax=Lentilactobacillus hilgardii TaxID=1588 RepID=UPI0039EADF32
MRTQKNDIKQLPLSDVTISKIVHINTLHSYYNRPQAKHQSRDALNFISQVFAIADRNHDKRSKERLLDRIAEIKKEEWKNHD